MADFKKPVFNADAAEEYFSMLLTSYRDTANDIFRRDNEGRHASEQHYSAEYQKYVGMQIAMREVLEYFGKFDLGDWISVKDRLPATCGEYLVAVKYDHARDEKEAKRDFDLATWGEVVYLNDGGRRCFEWTSIQNDWDEGNGFEITHWRPLPELPEVEA